MLLVFHGGGPRHGEVVPAALMASSVLAYEGPGGYQRLEPGQVQNTAEGPTEVWVVRD
ncbi:hypothetical protein SAMN05660657_02539 [Geodermatophilus amargosae]|uniref:Uncharacterized protein n=1 Tax=Geodermatophilus amargosae TaxID=1296565 RepID=A0A1I7A6D8_9ACTN|nr:hypothetical protein [Geodermatophilus amargosae]SFT70495.1 hypothetical protein SAMN05660657_02539 [Geodermatophilus amargosae]